MSKSGSSNVGQPMFILVLFLLVGVFESASAQPAKSSQYVTTAQCKVCHVDQFEAWSDSHHAWAWREPLAANVLGDFDNALFMHNGFSYRFETEDDAYVITADGPDGQPVRYPLRYVVGVTPLQQYLVETVGGRLQALDVAWDTERQHWYHLYPDDDTTAGNGFHWTGPYKNWNARCAECHATGYQKHYDPNTDSYHSQQAETGVGCEACHGPGEAHVAWAEQGEDFDRTHWLNVDARGMTPTLTTDDAQSQINVCATCHARREPLGANSPPPGAPFDNHYRLALLRDGLYFPDGQIRDEVYVYGSFLQSKMYARGVRCTDCHEAHSYTLKDQGNALCTQCHHPEGNPEYPTLTKSNYDSPAHHFHEQGTDGAACKNCHMIERDYMIVDGRRDHSFRVPRPDLSDKTGAPDVCTQCHQGKTPQWAAQEIKARYPQGRSGRFHFGEVFAAAAQGIDAQTAQQLVAIATDASVPPIVRAGAVQRLTPVANPSLAHDVAGLVSDDESAWVRMSATTLQRALPVDERIDAVSLSLSDPMASVRTEAAKALLDLPPTAIPEHLQMPLRQSMDELRQSLEAKADYPEIQMVIGGVALTLRNLAAATSAFQRAVEMDPQLVRAWMTLARIQAAQGDQGAVTDTLSRAIRANPDSAQLRQALHEVQATE